MQLDTKPLNNDEFSRAFAARQLALMGQLELMPGSGRIRTNVRMPPQFEKPRFIPPGGGGYLLDYANATFTRTGEAALSDPRDGWSFPLRTSAAEHLAYSQDALNLIVNPAWVPEGGGTITTGAVGPDGSTTAVVITDNSAVAYQGGETQTFAYISANDNYAGIWVKQDLAATGWTNLIIAYGGGGSVQIGFNQATGVAQPVSGTVVGPYVAKHDFGVYGVWYFVAWRHVGAAGATIQWWVRPAQGPIAGFANSAATTGSVTIWAPSVMDAIANGERATNPTPWAYTNEPRIFADGTILIEGSRTNGLDYSSVPSNVSWQKIGETATYTADAYVAPDGSGAESIDFPDTALICELRNENAVIADNANMVGSVYLRAPDGDTAAVDFGVRNKVAAQLTDLVSLTDAWVRHTIRQNVSVGGSTPILRMFESLTDSGAVFAPWGAQLEQGDCESSPVRTTTASALRASDILTFVDGSYPVELLTERQRWRVWPAFGHDSTPVSIISYCVFTYSGNGVNTSYGLEFQCQTTGVTRVGFKNAAGGLIVSTSVATWSPHQEITVDYDPSSGEMTLSGCTTGDGVYAPGAAPSDAPGGDLRIGRVGGASNMWFGVIDRPRAL